jgi:DNA invertase Pin-like site-specific DNA recombinase
MTKPKPKHLFLTKEELARRIRDGQSIAKKNGKHIGRPRTVDRDKVHQLRRDGCGMQTIATALKCSKFAIWYILKNP